MKMNKKIISVILICGISFALTGCDSDLSWVSKQSKPHTYVYKTNDSRFKVVSADEIDDGTVSGLTISILIDKETNIMYMQSEKYQSGYGLSLEVMVDQDGKPLIYNGDLNE